MRVIESRWVDNQGRWSGWGELGEGEPRTQLAGTGGGGRTGRGGDARVRREVCQTAEKNK